MSEQSKEFKEQKKGGFLVALFAYNAQNAQNFSFFTMSFFVLIITFIMFLSNFKTISLFQKLIITAPQGNSVNHYGCDELSEITQKNYKSMRKEKTLAMEITDVIATMFSKACSTTITEWKITERRCMNGDALLDEMRYCTLEYTLYYQWSFKCGATSAPRRWTTRKKFITIRTTSKNQISPSQ